MTLNDLQQRNGRYFALFYRFSNLGANYTSVVYMTDMVEGRSKQISFSTISVLIELQSITVLETP